MMPLIWKLYAALVLLVVLPLVPIEALLLRKSVRLALAEWCAYWPANGWGKADD